MAGDEKELNRLFGLPLDEFTSARNELAKRLKAEKETEAAEAIRTLPKPSVPAWTINQLSRVDREGIRTLLQAGEALRTAQQRLLSGEDAGDDLREATARERQAVESLTERARALLRDAHRPTTSGVLDRIGTTLRAAAVTDEGRALLEAGRLTSELEPAGFDAFALTEPRAHPRQKAARGREEPDERRRREREKRQHQAELREKARAAERAAREAEREAERAEKAAADARRVAERARAEADAAAAELADA
jgi:hypothetical protein